MCLAVPNYVHFFGKEKVDEQFRRRVEPDTDEDARRADVVVELQTSAEYKNPTGEDEAPRIQEDKDYTYSRPRCFLQCGPRPHSFSSEPLRQAVR